MRIVHVLLSKNFSGAERHVLELAEKQAEQHEVHLILHRKGFGDRASAIAPRVSERVHVHKVGSWLRQWTFFQVRQCIKRLQADIVHCHLKAASKSVRGLTNGPACIGTLHIDYEPAQHDHMDGLIAITPWQQQRMPPAVRQLSRQIDNWVSGDAATEEEATNIRQEYGISDKQILVGTIGRIESSKQQAQMIEAAQAVLPAGGRIAVVGYGRLYDSLREQYPDVIMPGYSTQPKAWLRAFDVFVSAADFEPFGLVFLEAMQSGTPIVATATEGAMHLAPEMGITPVAIGDSEALGEAIAAQIKEGRQRRSYSLTDFSLQQKSQQTLAFYAESIARKQRHSL